MRLSVLLPATFVLALVSGTALADRTNEDLRPTATPRHEQTRVLRDRYAHRDKTVDRVHRDKARHDRSKVKNQRAEPRINCADDSCGSAVHGVQKESARHGGGSADARRPAVLTARASARVNCSPQDDTCGTQSTRSQPSDRAKSEKAHKMSPGQLEQMHKAFLRLMQKACERRGRQCGGEGE
ncbi:MAG: hypothetical protein HY908_16095 [Myxococcales bacterium]|nr:hypothetical protein [Myxococcales bacterium]